MNILITGPESTGKSSIALQLADSLNGHLITEYARDYLMKKNGNYNLEDIRKIAEGHLESVKNISPNSINIFDTFLINLKIWSIRKFGICDPFILENIDKIKFEKVLLLYPDIQWQEDPLRESKGLRISIFEDFLKELDNLCYEYCIIKGTGVNRFNQCIEYIGSI